MKKGPLLNLSDRKSTLSGPHAHPRTQLSIKYPPGYYLKGPYSLSLSYIHNTTSLYNVLYEHDERVSRASILWNYNHNAIDKRPLSFTITKFCRPTFIYPWCPRGVPWNAHKKITFPPEFAIKFTQYMYALSKL